MDLKSDKAKSLTKQQVFEELKAYCQEQILLAQRKAIDEDTFDKPAWAQYQAYQLQCQLRGEFQRCRGPRFPARARLPSTVLSQRSPDHPAADCIPRASV